MINCMRPDCRFIPGRTLSISFPSAANPDFPPYAKMDSRTTLTNLDSGSASVWFWALLNWFIRCWDRTRTVAPPTARTTGSTLGRVVSTDVVEVE